MRRFRFSIRSLLLLVLFVGVAFAALRASNDAWDAGIFGLTLLILLSSVLLAVHRTDRRRSYWLGFALFGWAYLGISLVPTIESRLPTAKGLAYIDSRVPRQVTERQVTELMAAYRWLASGPRGQSGSPPPVVPDLTKAGGQGWAYYSWMFNVTALSGSGGTTENFVRIGHSLLALVMGFFGGLLSRWMFDRNKVDTAGGDRT